MPVFWVASEDHDIDEVRRARFPEARPENEVVFELPHAIERRPLSTLAIDGIADDALAAAVSEAGPLGERELRLVKLAIAIGALAEGSVRSNTRRALTAGATVDEIRQVALCAITTRGFPAAVAALGWIADVTGEPGDAPQ